ncbi:hypothetical protein COOONC_25014 [Cooperia oncophora]
MDREAHQDCDTAFETDDIHLVTESHEQMPGEMENVASSHSSDSDSDIEMQVCLKSIERVNRLRVMVGAEIAKHFRLGDSKRDQIQAVLEQNTARILKRLQRLKETIEKRTCALATLDKVKEHFDLNSEDDVANKLEQLVIGECTLNKLARKLNCDKTGVKRRVKGLIKNETVLMNSVSSLQEVCNQKDEEIRALKEELEKQKRRLAELEGSQDREGRVGQHESLPGRVMPGISSVNDASDVSESDEHFQSGWHMREKKKGCRRERFSSSSRRNCKDPGMSHDYLNTSNSESMSEKIRKHRRKSSVRTQDKMGEYLRYVASPDVSPYSGKEKYSLNFVEAFELK